MENTGLYLNFNLAGVSSNVRDSFEKRKDFLNTSCCDTLEVGLQRA
jgi:hypothetical protein